MKRFIMVLLSVLLVVCLFTGCDGNAVSELVDDGKIYTNAKTCIIGENYITSRFGKELCSRFKNRTGSLNDASRSLLNNTEVVIVDGKYLDEVDFDKNLIWHALKGKTLIINEPTVATYTGVEVMLSAFMTPGYGIMTEDEQALYADELRDLETAFLNTLKDVEVDTSQLPPEEFDIELLKKVAKDAVAIRGKHVYVVTKIEKPMTLSKDDVHTFEIDENGNEKEVEPQKDDLPSSPTATDFSQNYVEAANFLVKWTKGEYDPNKADSRSAANLISSRSGTDGASRGTSSDLADLIDAQTFSYSFTAQKPKDYDGSNETVNVNMTAWTACNIDKQLDYYAVKTQVILNNQQLNYRNEWNKTDDDGNWAYCGPFLEKVEVVGSPCDLSGTSKYVDHSPLNKTDSSTSVTTGSTFSVGFNIGLSKSGPSGGLSMSKTFSKSESRQVPDIAINSTGNDNGSASWVYTVAPFDCRRSGTHLIGNGAKDVAHKQLILDNWQVFTVPSDMFSGSLMSSYWKVDVLSFVKVYIGGFHGHTYHKYIFTIKYTTDHPVEESGALKLFSIRKPNAAKANYLMSFEAPADVDVISATNVFKDISPDFNTSTAYYALNKKELDSSARTYFQQAMTVFERNADVVRSKRITGKFKFFLKSENGNRVAEKELTF